MERRDNGMSMLDRRATINDVARLAGVSIKTVSRVLNQAPNVRAATRNKVVAAAKSLDYSPNLSARQLASNRTFLIGMMYDAPNPDNENDYVTMVQSGAIHACRETGYHLLISPYPADAPDLLDEVVGLSRQVDGLILLQPLSDLEPLNRLLVERVIPCVRASQRPFDGLSWISVADVDGADEMTQYLIDLGHRRIGFIVGHPDHGQSHDRLAGYRRALERNGIAYEPTLVKQGLFDYASGLSCGRELLAGTEPPTAIFASSDAMAMGVLSAAHQLGFGVPSRVSVAGFDDSPLSRHAWPPLTTVRQPITEVARLATKVLLDQLQNRSGGDSHHCLGAELVRRASTAGPALTTTTR